MKYCCNECKNRVDGMERLTLKEGLCGMASTEFCFEQKDCHTCSYGRKCFKRLAAYEDAIPLERAQELSRAEKDGRLVVLPCKVGDTVYEVNKRGFISTYKVISIHLSSCSTLIGWELVDGIYSNLNGFEISAFEKSVFLTREEAEAALKKREDLTYDHRRSY